MTFTFKNTTPIFLVVKTPEADLQFCETCGGINARARTSAKIDCEDCGTTGYSNLYYRIGASASIKPGAVKQWNSQAGALDYLGDVAIKLPGKFRDLLSAAEWIEMDGVAWRFAVLREPGRALGQHRLVLALTRK